MKIAAILFLPFAAFGQQIFWASGAAGGATVPILNVAASQNNTYATSPITATFGQSNTAGNLLTACIMIEDGTTTVTSITGNGNTWVHAITSHYVALGTSSEIWYALNANAGTGTATVTLSSGTIAAVTLNEFSGIALSSALDQTAAVFGGGGTGPTGAGPVTTTFAHELILAFGASNSGTSTGAGYTALQLFANTYTQLNEYQVVSSTGSYSGTFSGSANFNIVMATFKGR